MSKGEIMAISPKNRGKYPDKIVVLLKDETNYEKWRVVADAIGEDSVKRGYCEFELKYNTITQLKLINKPIQQPEQSVSKEMPEGHTFPIEKLDIVALSNEINKLNKKRRVAATQVFPLKSDGKPLYNALVYFEEPRKWKKK